MFALLINYTAVPNQTNRVLKNIEPNNTHESLGPIVKEIITMKKNKFMTGTTTVSILKDFGSQGWKVVDVVPICHTS